MDQGIIGGRNPATFVLHELGAKVRTFLYSLSQGTTDYRSLHNLTEQVEHQYHGRFLVELIQNAHDQLPESIVGIEAKGRIQICLTDEGPYGTLYVANDGQPFSASNFTSLSNLGQSDKDPEASIGHKGIGFRSVLEIADAPEIYSRLTRDSEGFDGFCFGFSPDVIQRLYKPIIELLRGEDSALSPFGAELLVDWDKRLIEQLRSSIGRRADARGLAAEEWLREEMTYLSPYMLPIPLNPPDGHIQLTEFAKNGLSTVIRFPLKNSSAASMVSMKLASLAPHDLLFLPRLSSLDISCNGQQQQLTRRRSELPESRHGGTELLISDSDGGGTDRFWMWEHVVELAEAPEPVQAAIRGLPGKWPQLRKAVITIAVPVVAEPAAGIFSIYLPTPLESGCGAHVNAPFFGDMSRTHIDFGDGESISDSAVATYNDYLLSHAASLTVSVIANELAGTSTPAGCAIVDLLAPMEQSGHAGERWKRLIDAATSQRGMTISAEPWMISDRGWSSLADTSLLPEIRDATVLTEAELREHATFAVYLTDLESRRELVERLSDSYVGSAYPSLEDRADTLEQVAQSLQKDTQADWNAFWKDAHGFMGGQLADLRGREVLLGSDIMLHACGDRCAVFFAPKQGVGEDEELENAGDVRDIPDSLTPYVAFLNDRIQIHEEKGGRTLKTDVRQQLESAKLVSRFDREVILRDVLIARIPELPIALDSPAAGLCRDILLWGLRLTANLAAQGQGAQLVQLLRKLPTPCQGGWFPLGETSFGPGWPGTHGEAVAEYLKRVDTAETEAARERLLLAPSHEHWGGTGTAHQELLRKSGVFDGLRLAEIKPQAWSSEFEAYRASFHLPGVGPSGWSRVDWLAYREVTRCAVRPAYRQGAYEVQLTYSIPGLDRYASLDEHGRLAFMDVVLRSAGQWPKAWETLVLERRKGNADTLTLRSPLAWKLSELNWIGVTERDELSWSRPADRWHVPASALLGGQAWQFAHLRPLPATLATQLDLDTRLQDAMRQLGMPRFDPETMSASARLLEALADSASGEEIRNWDIFLGQVRAAWRAFEPVFSTSFPKKLLVHKGISLLSIHIPDEEHPCYLPNSTKSFTDAMRRFQLPVVAIERSEAERLADQFTTAYPGSIVLASTLRAVPLEDGHQWSGPADGRLQDNDQLDGLIPLVLTIAAYFGPRAQGTATKSFRDHMAVLREARVAVVHALKTALFDDDKAVADPIPVAGLWHGESRTLLVSDPSTADATGISEAVAALLDREDLEFPIKHALSITGWESDAETLAQALEQLKLEEADYRAVREQWRGDLSQVIQRLLPLLTILRPDANLGVLMGLDTEDRVIAFLDRLDDERLQGSDLVDMVRAAADIFEFGCSAVNRFGDLVQLSNWNEALRARGDSPLKNADAEAEFRAHISSADPMLRSVIAWVAVRNSVLAPFPELILQLESLTCPDRYRTELWQVSFVVTMTQVASLFETWGADAMVLAALLAAKNQEELRVLLAAHGIDLSVDPSEMVRANREKLQGALRRLEQLGLAWAIATKAIDAGAWEARLETYLTTLGPTIDRLGYLRLWTDQDVWLHLKSLPADKSAEAFWTEVLGASSLDDLAERLGLSADMVAEAKKQLAQLKEDARRRARMIPICGHDFDGSDDNLASLWSHISGALPAADLSSLGAVDLGTVIDLDRINARKRERKGETPTAPKPPPKRVSKSMESLIGLAGEIHAFRMLQSHYGTHVVSAPCWISGNSAIARLNPREKTDDSKGCDLIIPLDGQTFHIEVKASQGDDASFTLGSSEVRLAMELTSRPKRRKKDVFKILCVSNALTSRPIFRMLPNPYDPRYQSLFALEEAGARVRYRQKRQ